MKFVTVIIGSHVYNGATYCPNFVHMELSIFKGLAHQVLGLLASVQIQNRFDLSKKMIVK